LFLKRKKITWLGTLTDLETEFGLTNGADFYAALNETGQSACRIDFGYRGKQKIVAIS